MVFKVQIHERTSQRHLTLPVTGNTYVSYMLGQIQFAWDTNVSGDRLMFKGEILQNHQTLNFQNVPPEADLYLTARGGGGASKRLRPADITPADKLDALVSMVQGQAFMRVDSVRLDKAHAALERITSVMALLEDNPSAIMETIGTFDYEQLEEMLVKYDAMPRGGSTRTATLSKICMMLYPDVGELAEIIDVFFKARANMANRFNAAFVTMWHRCNTSDAVVLQNYQLVCLTPSTRLFDPLN